MRRKFLRFSLIPHNRATTVAQNHYNMINAIYATQSNSCNARNSQNKQANATINQKCSWSMLEHVYRLKSPLQMYVQSRTEQLTQLSQLTIRAYHFLSWGVPQLAGWKVMDCWILLLLLMNLAVVFQRAEQKYIVLVLLPPKFPPVLLAISSPVFPLFLTKFPPVRLQRWSIFDCDAMPMFFF